MIGPHRGSCFEGTREPSLIKAIARARDWYERIVAGVFNTIRRVALKVGLTRRYVRRILRCASLSPQITDALPSGNHLPGLGLKEILRGVPLNWREQDERLSPSTLKVDLQVPDDGCCTEHSERFHLIFSRIHSRVLFL